MAQNISDTWASILIWYVLFNSVPYHIRAFVSHVTPGQTVWLSFISGCSSTASRWKSDRAVLEFPWSCDLRVNRSIVNVRCLIIIVPCKHLHTTTDPWLTTTHEKPICLNNLIVLQSIYNDAFPQTDVHFVVIPEVCPHSSSYKTLP